MFSDGMKPSRKMLIPEFDQKRKEEESFQRSNPDTLSEKERKTHHLELDLEQ